MSASQSRKRSATLTGPLPQQYNEISAAGKLYKNIFLAPTDGQSKLVEPGDSLNDETI
jgi:hypothetical protein